jgi:hypothetical protein
MQALADTLGSSTSLATARRCGVRRPASMDAAPCTWSAPSPLCAPCLWVACLDIYGCYGWTKRSIWHWRTWLPTALPSIFPRFAQGISAGDARSPYAFAQSSFAQQLSELLRTRRPPPPHATSPPRRSGHALSPVAAKQGQESGIGDDASAGTIDGDLLPFSFPEGKLLRTVCRQDRGPPHCDKCGCNYPSLRPEAFLSRVRCVIQVM